MSSNFDLACAGSLKLGILSACARAELLGGFKVLMFTAPACAFAQPAHHRLFPSAGSP